jgi:hypothetical protein
MGEREKMAAYPVLEFLVTISETLRTPLSAPPLVPHTSLVAWPTHPNLFAQELQVTFSSNCTVPSSHTPPAPVVSKILYRTLGNSSQRVFASSLPLLSPSECQWIIDLAEREAQQRGGEGWSTSRHYAVPTTDLPVQQMPALLSWFNEAMATRLGPLLVAQLIESQSTLLLPYSL